ncbi:uncharacterized protein LOC111892112 [Lactuca sativa]|uniref:uncharacterized protein LOC111892112 n=1 Tax=Lactuca sativa TaxID=4236 RepID=UPI000CD9B784|nr:uncharacterized protein LOC111892112 [Lactuca sativa]
MLPKWMIDVPDRLDHDWYVFARPSGKRCFVVSSNGTTISRLRNGSLLHRFPSSLPNGARTREGSRSAQSYCILDCIFHELDQTTLMGAETETSSRSTSTLLLPSSQYSDDRKEKKEQGLGFVGGCSDQQKRKKMGLG